MNTDSSKDVVVRTFLRRWDTVYTWIPDIIADRDPEPLHQFRVSIRYLLSMDSIFGLTEFAPLPGDWCSQLKIVMKHAGPVRDLDVHLQVVETRINSSETETRASLTRFLKHLRSVRIPLQNQLVNALNRLPHIASGLTVIEPSKIKSFRVPEDWIDRLEKTSDRIRKRIDRIEKYSPNEAVLKQLHKIRILMKSVRYPVTVLNEIMAGKWEEALVQFKQVQDLLGNLHDNVELWKLLEQYGEKDDALQKYSDEIRRLKSWYLDRFNREWGEGQLHQFLRGVIGEIAQNFGNDSMI